MMNPSWCEGSSLSKLMNPCCWSLADRRFSVAEPTTITVGSSPSAGGSGARTGTVRPHIRPMKPASSSAAWRFLALYASPGTMQIWEPWTWLEVQSCARERASAEAVHARNGLLMARWFLWGD